MDNQKIMIVDDDANICELLRIYLEKDGFSTLVLVWAAFAVSPAKAADKANAFHTHNPMQTQKDPTVYKTHVTSRFNCSSQGPAEALLHTGGTRLKENLTLALPRPFGEKGPARHHWQGPRQDCRLQRRASRL